MCTRARVVYLRPLRYICTSTSVHKVELTYCVGPKERKKQRHGWAARAAAHCHQDIYARATAVCVGVLAPCAAGLLQLTVARARRAGITHRSKPPASREAPQRRAAMPSHCHTVQLPRVHEGAVPQHTPQCHCHWLQSLRARRPRRASVWAHCRLLAPLPLAHQPAAVLLVQILMHRR